MTDHLHQATLERQRTMLRTAMGPAIAAALEDNSVVEVMVNPDGKLWLDRHGEGRSDTGAVIEAAEVERIVRMVASHIGRECHAGKPVVSAELPETGERFEGLLPPVVTAPCFAIRKPAQLLYRLQDYVESGMMTGEQAAVLKDAVLDRQNIVVIGGTGSGKTTLVNALLAEVAATNDRVLILEDTRELSCAAEDCINLRTQPDVASLGDLVRSTLRLRPDRIIVGEVRGGETLDMLKAWNTGHPGGITTLHANSARAGLYRLEQLIQEATSVVPRRLIADAAHRLVFIKGRGANRRIQTIAALEGLTADGDYRLRSLSQ